MKKTLLALFVLISISTTAQVVEEFNIEMEPLTITDAPGVQSYTWGKTQDGKWIIVGGRIDGLHRRQPWAAFQEIGNNKMVFVIDPVADQVWFSNLDVLSTSIFEQLQSTNQNFHQRDSILYIVGGYGFSTTAGDHITYPNLTAINVDQLADSVIAGGDINPAFRQTSDPLFKVTGGQMERIDSTFYLVGGHLFDGAYNPMGPDHGPGFTQVYTCDIRTFKIDDDGVTMTPYDLNVAYHDTINLHRRDYNMAPQIFPTGEFGFTAFSGVFDYSDMPYLNVVDITESNGYVVNNSFNQMLSQYHSAKMPVYDTAANVMHTLFFGGLSQFQFDATGSLVEDIDVPFVKTISRVSRFDDGSMTETDLNYIEMPTLVGAGAEFIPYGPYWYEHGILDLNAVPQTKTLVGYVYGGIESSEENIFFINDGTQSTANNVAFEVYINKSTVSQEEIQLNSTMIVDLNVYPNPAKKKLNVEFFAASFDPIQIQIVSTEGKLVRDEIFEPMSIGDQELKLSIADLDSGSYVIVVNNGAYKDQKQFVKK